MNYKRMWEQLKQDIKQQNIKYLFNQDKTKKFEVKEYKEKRSKDANAY